MPKNQFHEMSLGESKFAVFRTVPCTVPHISLVNNVEISEILTHSFFAKFRESNGFTKEITK